MAITATGPVQASITTDQSAYPTATYTPTSSGLLVLIGIVHSGPATVADATSITGASVSSVTKILTVPFNTIAAGAVKLELWAALSTASASAITINLPGAPTGCGWTVAEFVGVDTAQGTLGVIQSVSNSTDTAGTAMTATLGAFASTVNGAHAVFGMANSIGITGKAGWTRLGDTNYATPATGVGFEYIASNDTAVSATAGASSRWAAIAVEIAAFVSPTDPNSTISGFFNTRDW